MQNHKCKRSQSAQKLRIVHIKVINNSNLKQNFYQNHNTCMDTFSRKNIKNKFQQKSHQLTHTWEACGWWTCRTCFCLVLPRELKQWGWTTWRSSSVKTNPSIRIQKNFIIHTKSTSHACAQVHMYTNTRSHSPLNSNVAFDLPASIWNSCKSTTGRFSFGFSQLTSHTKCTEKSNGNCFLTFILTYIRGTLPRAPMSMDNTQVCPSLEVEKTVKSQHQDHDSGTHVWFPPVWRCGTQAPRTAPDTEWCAPSHAPPPAANTTRHCDYSLHTHVKIRHVSLHTR